MELCAPPRALPRAARMVWDDAVDALPSAVAGSYVEMSGERGWIGFMQG
jgi:hypothetical protein